MKNKLFFVIYLILLFVAFSVSADAKEIRISAATSLIDAVKEVISGYQQVDGTVTILPNFASSGSLAKQISAGAPADIYISANPKWMAHLQQQGLIADDSKQVLVQNSLVFVGMPGTASALADLPKLKRIALGSPKSTPVGRYSEQALTKAGIYQQLQKEKTLVLTKDVRQALLYVDRGEVDGAFVYLTDALLLKQAEVLISVPQELYQQVNYPAALTTEGSGKSNAAEFFEYLLGPKAQLVFKKYGFIVAD